MKRAVRKTKRGHENSLREELDSWIAAVGTSKYGYAIAAMALAGYEKHGRGMVVSRFHLRDMARYEQSPRDADYSYIAASDSSTLPHFVRDYDPKTQFVMGASVRYGNGKVLSSAKLISTNLTPDAFGEAAKRAVGARGSEKVMVHVSDAATHACAVCGSREGLMRCGKCRVVWYCSQAHQKEHWATHRRTCKKDGVARSRETGAAEKGT